MNIPPHSIDKLVQSVRDLSVHGHCPEVTLSQECSSTPLSLQGHGLLRINSYGNLFLEFVAHKWSRPPSITPLPTNPFNKKQLFTLEATLVSGQSFVSTELHLPRPTNSSTDHYYYYEILLWQIDFKSECNPRSPTKSQIYGECIEKPELAANRSIVTEQYSSWSRAEFESCEHSVDIQVLDSYSSISVTGDSSSLDQAYEAIVFYLALTSGIYPQPYFQQRYTGTGVTSSLFTRNNIRSTERIPQPTTAFISYSNNQLDPTLHHGIGKSLVKLSLDNPQAFWAIRGAWNKLFFAWQVPNREIAATMLCTGIESLLNSLYSNPLQVHQSDEQLDSDKLTLQKAFSKSIPGVTSKGMQRIKSQIGSWGKLYAKQMLLILCALGLITKQEVNTWIDLRNSNTHPRFTSKDHSLEVRLQYRTKICLGLFYKLLFHALSYEGALYDFSSTEPGQPELIYIPSVLKMDLIDTNNEPEGA